METHIEALFRAVQVIHADCVESVVQLGFYHYIRHQISRGLEKDAAQCHGLIQMDVLDQVLTHSLLYLEADRLVWQCGHRHHANVLGVLSNGRQYEMLDTAVSHGRDMLLGQITHALLRLNPRTSALAPAGTVEYADLNVQFSSLLQGCMQYLPPFRAQHLDIARLHARLPYVADESPVYACLLHSFQIALNSFHRDVVRDPIPIDSHPLLAPGGLELIFQRVHSGTASATCKKAACHENEGCGQCRKTFFHRITFLSVK